MVRQLNIRIEYDGIYPNLCSGTLIVYVGEKRWKFPECCLDSGGSVTFDEKWNGNVEEGPWDIDEWPDGFPEELKETVLEMINDEIPFGCCGGCV